MRAPVRLIFLDIDGVLVTRRCYLHHSGLWAPGDPDCIAQLNNLLDQTGANLVISSTWRLEGLMFMREKLAEWGVRERRVLDVTPRLPGVQPQRGDEIQAWLDEYREYRDVESFVILDDDSDMAHLEPYLVKTSMDQGLTKEHVECAARILNNE